MINSTFNFQKYINYLFVALAFSFAISKAATNFFEILILLLWVLEGNWKVKLDLYKKNALNIAVFSLIGFSLLSILWHGNILMSLEYVAKYRHLLIIFVFYSSLQKKYISFILSAFLLSIFLSELISYGIFFELIHYKNILPSDPTPFMSHMTYSTVLAFTSSILLLKFLFESNIKYKLPYIIFFLTATTNLFINGGRSGQIIFIILIFLIFINFMKHKIKAIFFSLSLIFFVFSSAYYLSPNFQKRSTTLYSDISNIVHNKDYNGSAGARLALNIIGLHTFLDYPLLGTGLAYSIKDADKYRQENSMNINNIEIYADYHNAFLTISVQLGIIGLLISFLLVYSLVTLKYQSKEYKIMSLLFITAFGLFSLTHNTFHTMNPLVFFSLFAGFFNAVSRIDRA